MENLTQPLTVCRLVKVSPDRIFIDGYKLRSKAVAEGLLRGRAVAEKVWEQGIADECEGYFLCFPAQDAIWCLEWDWSARCWRLLRLSFEVTFGGLYRLVRPETIKRCPIKLKPNRKLSC